SLMVDGVEPEAIIDAWALVPARLFADPAGNALTVLSSMFLHDPSGFGHIAGNMLFLWIFGDNVEDAVGHLRYAVFYVTCGVVAAAAQILLGQSPAIPMLGASGAISGVLAAYAVLYPRAPITV